MSMEIKVPPLGESVTEATVAKWYKKPGDIVKIDELVVELETDKITLEINSPASGTMGEIKSNQGASVKVGDVLGNIQAGDVKAIAPISAPQVSPVVAVSPAVTTQVHSTVPSVIASPSATKIAAEQNVNLSNIVGSGKDGRVTKGDVLQVASSAQAVQVNSRQEERVRMTRLRKRIAERLKESQNTAAILTTFNEIDMTNVIQIRNKYKDVFEKKHGVKLGFMSFFVKAAIAALKEIPEVNASIEGDEIVYRNYYDIGVAVGTEQGLVVPVLRNAENMSFADIEKAIANYGKKAREGKLSIEDLTGGTFTVSNGGVYGSLLSTPIINPPQSGILGMHKTQERPMAIDGKVEIRPMMYLALSYDHRIIDGREAVTFLVKVKENVESPERLLFGL